MKNRCVVLTFAAATAAFAQEANSVPRHEIGLTLGGLLSQTRENAGARLDLGSGIALQANYGYRFLGGRRAALFGEVHFLANPLRDVSSQNGSFTRDVATIFLTPGLRLKFNGGGRISPYVAIGGGWAVFEQSTAQLNGNPNPASRTVNHGAFDYGGGVDVKFWRFVGLRGEVRDFYTGSPSYNTRLISGGQHNVVVGGCLVLKFGR
jgi:opacity protein-like surface antigen